MNDKEKLKILSQAILKSWGIVNNHNDYDEYECIFCGGRTLTRYGDSDVPHTLNCPVTIAKKETTQKST